MKDGNVPRLPGRFSGSHAVHSNKLEYGPGTITAGFPSSLGFGVGGQSYSSNFSVLLYGGVMETCT